MGATQVAHLSKLLILIHLFLSGTFRSNHTKTPIQTRTALQGSAPDVITPSVEEIGFASSFDVLYVIDSVYDLSARMPVLQRS